MPPSALDPLARAAARVGTVLRGEYRLDRVLGAGGMAVVYEATHRNGRRFAIKMLRAELSTQGDVRARFVREAYAANTLAHPGTVAVLDDDTAEDGSAFLVMELLDGADLEGLWERHARRLSAEQVLAIGYELLEVLAAAHAQHVVHGDIKPANLFLTREGRLKLLDFGAARVRDAARHAARCTGGDTLLGTAAFVAPEQARGEASEIDARTDLWAVGATLFTLFSGRTVHGGESAAEGMRAAGTTRARSLASVVPDAPAPLVAVVDPALAFDRAARWPSAAAMRGAVHDAHLAIVGQPIARETLLTLADSSASTREARAGTEAYAVGGTTAQPVSSSRASSPGADESKRERWVLGAAIACTLVLACAALASRASVSSKWRVRSVAAARAPSSAPPGASSPPPASPTPATESAASYARPSKLQ